jgi:hypothetical protein
MADQSPPPGITTDEEQPPTPPPGSVAGDRDSPAARFAAQQRRRNAAQASVRLSTSMTGSPAPPGTQPDASAAQQAPLIGDEDEPEISAAPDAEPPPSIPPVPPPPLPPPGAQGADAITPAPPRPPPPPHEVPVPEPPAAPAGTPPLVALHLRVTGDIEPPAEFTLPPGTYKIGREALLPLGHSTVSRQHARFDVRPERATIEDLGSTNGTKLNDQRLDAVRPIRTGDSLQLGDVTLEVVQAPEP